jgi:heterodisulfide reductase subunit A-like polyferredoxin
MTSREGIYVCGAFGGPKDIPETVITTLIHPKRSQAFAAAVKNEYEQTL